MDKINLKQYGFTNQIKKEALNYSNLHPARICVQNHDIYKAICENGEITALVSGKFLYNAQSEKDFPVVGDWVMIDRTDNSAGNAVIHHVLTRKSIFERKAAGTSNSVQIIASNIDTIFICMSLYKDFNLRRLERYLTIALNSSSISVIILTKSDLCDDLEKKLEDISSVCAGVDILVCSAMAPDGIKELFKYISEGKTIAFIGSSGVGKSTLINKLMQSDILSTGRTRSDGKGSHTTTYRQMLMLPSGGIVIDTPGMRELQIESGDLSKSFNDIESLALKCKFRDCSHNSEPGCAVRQAVVSGKLSQKRFDNYKKLQTELSYEHLNSRMLENEKIKKMFGSKAEMKRTMKHAKNKRKY